MLNFEKSRHFYLWLVKLQLWLCLLRAIVDGRSASVQMESRPRLLLVFRFISSCYSCSFSILLLCSKRILTPIKEETTNTLMHVPYGFTFYRDIVQKKGARAQRMLKKKLRKVRARICTPTNIFCVCVKLFRYCSGTVSCIQSACFRSAHPILVLSSVTVSRHPIFQQNNIIIQRKSRNNKHTQCPCFRGFHVVGF